jgi:hypothetical protein
MESAEPIRLKLRTEMLEPREHASNTLTLDPNLPKPNKEMLLPKRVKLRNDKEDDQELQSRMDIKLPSRTQP